MLATFLTLLAIGFALAILYTAFRAAVTARTPQGAAGWAIFFLLAPHIALIAFMFLGHHRLRGYVTARRASQQIMEELRKFAAENAPRAGSTPINMRPFEKTADLLACGGNNMEVLIDGAATFDAIFRAIDCAESYILIQSYIIHDDQLGRDLQKHLIAASKRGVRVRLMMDGVGSRTLPDSYVAALRQANVQVLDPKSQRGPKYRFQINFRNHRKTVIVDGNVGFTGGLNVGDEYMGRDPKFGHWRDTHLRMTGPIVSQLQLIFAEDWHWATDENLLEDVTWQTAHAEQDRTGLIVATGPADEEETGSLMFFSAITAAKTRFWISSPYFVPDLDILSALKHAAMRGVDVRILVPDDFDHRIPWLAAFAYFDEVRAAGVRVFRYTDGFVHQKVFLTDDVLAAIGTANLDNRSFRLNFETMALMFDSDAAAIVEKMLRKDFENAFELTRTLADQPAYIRFGAPLARLFAPIL